MLTLDQLTPEFSSEVGSVVGLSLLARRETDDGGGAGGFGVVGAAHRG